MSVVPQIFNGLKGKRDANVIGESPTFGYSNNGFNEPTIRLNYERTTRLENWNNMRGSVLNGNDGGISGVAPCKGNPNTLLNGSRVLRRPNISYMGGLYPHTGYARNQPKGLAYDPQKPINNPLMPLADSFNAGLNSRIPQPA